MPQIHFLLLWVRVALYFFTTVSLLTAAASFVYSINARREVKGWHIFALIGFSALLTMLAVAAILKAFNLIMLSDWVIDYPVTLIMAFISFACWRLIWITSTVKPKKLLEKDGVIENSKMQPQ